MDPARLAITFAVLMIGIGVGRLVVGSIGPTGDVLATLFVPPDRALGWPRGVQESDEPWAWRTRPQQPQLVGDLPEASDPPDLPGDDVWRGPSRGSFVVPVDRVRRR